MALPGDDAKNPLIARHVFAARLQIPVRPLTTATLSREYLASGTFTGLLIGPEEPRGVLEVGYEIGCGIDMSTSNGVTMAGSTGITRRSAYRDC
jgi:hypothetical protein